MSESGTRPAGEEPTGVPPEGNEASGGGAGAADAPDAVPGERGVASVHRARSLQSRLSNVLAAGLMAGLGVAALSWYYAHVFARQRRAVAIAQRTARTQASGNAPLPPIASFRRPTDPASASAPLAAQLLGPPPALPPASAADNPADRAAAEAAWQQAEALQRVSAAGPPEGPAGRQTLSPRARALEQQLSGPVFAAGSGSAPTAAAPSGSAEPTPTVGMPWGMPGTWSTGERPARRQGDPLSALLRPTVTPAVEASVLPTQRLLLPKGAFIDCTLETAIDSTLPGMTTCVTATDTFSADGTVVLLGRGTQLIGETRGQVRQGQERVFVLWTEARTPTGVVVPLDSPGTDALGRAGLTGKVDTHFWERFGAAILVSVIDAGVQAGVQASGNGTVIVNPSTSEDVMTGVLQSTVAIPPTIRVRQGARIQVLVARDVDFRSVYRLALVPGGPVPVAHAAAPRKEVGAQVFQGAP